jgi:hypothetical protein
MSEVDESLPLTLWSTQVPPTVWLVVIRREKHVEPEVYTNSLLAFARCKKLAEQEVKADWLEVPLWSELQEPKREAAK